jgi:hypothetical protein
MVPDLKIASPISFQIYDGEKAIYSQ